MSVSMHTTTTTQLLEALFGPGEEAVWREFDARYRPIIFAFARELGVAAEDAADVAQQTLTEFLRDYRAGKYDRRRGRLRAWIIGIARHRVLDTLRQRTRNQAVRGLQRQRPRRSSRRGRVPSRLHRRLRSGHHHPAGRTGRVRRQ